MYLKWIAIWTHTNSLCAPISTPEFFWAWQPGRARASARSPKPVSPGVENVFGQSMRRRELYKSRWPGYIRPTRCSSLTLYLGKKCPYWLFPPRLFGWIFSKYYLDNTDRKEIKDKEWLKEQWYNEMVSIF